MYYCDQCAKVKEYPLQAEKIRRACDICENIFLCNFTDKNDLPLNNINQEVWKTKTFQVRQLQSVPPNLGRLQMMEPNSISHKVMGADTVLFYMGSNKDKNRELRLDNPLTGERMQIIINSGRT
jgi:hypothetical protein